MTERFKVVVTDFLNDGFAIEKDVLDDIADIVPADAKKEDDLIGIIEDADALIAYHMIVLTEKTPGYNGLYHVTVRGWERRVIVDRDRVREDWLRLLDRVATRSNWRVLAWVLIIIISISSCGRRLPTCRQTCMT